MSHCIKCILIFSLALVATAEEPSVPELLSLAEQSESAEEQITACMLLAKYPEELGKYQSDAVKLAGGLPDAALGNLIFALGELDGAVMSAEVRALLLQSAQSPNEFVSRSAVIAIGNAGREDSDVRWALISSAVRHPFSDAHNIELMRSVVDLQSTELSRVLLLLWQSRSDVAPRVRAWQSVLHAMNGDVELSRSSLMKAKGDISIALDPDLLARELLVIEELIDRLID